MTNCCNTLEGIKKNLYFKTSLRALEALEVFYNILGML